MRTKDVGFRAWGLKSRVSDFANFGRAVKSVEVMTFGSLSDPKVGIAYRPRSPGFFNKCLEAVFRSTLHSYKSYTYVLASVADFIDGRRYSF